MTNDGTALNKNANVTVLGRSDGPDRNCALEIMNFPTCDALVFKGPSQDGKQTDQGFHWIATGEKIEPRETVK